MKIQELNQINKDPDFLYSRYKFHKQLLIGLTFGGSLLVGFWLLFDRFYTFQNTNELLWLRLITVAVYIINLIVALYRKNNEAYYQHVVTGFYFGTTYCMLLAMFTGATQSPYWYGLFFILIAWFVMMSLPYYEMIIHGIMFIVIFIVGLFSQSNFEIQFFELGKISLLYFGVMIIGIFSAISKNIASAINFKSESEIKKINQTLNDNQQFLNNILTNAPLVIWSIDLEGNFTYSQYSGQYSTQNSERIGKSAFEVYKGTPGETFLRKVLRDEIRNDLLLIGSIQYDTRVSSIYNSSGEKTGYMGVSLDITERIKTENELKKYRLVLDQAPLAVFIMDKGGNFEYLNPEFVKLSGYTEEDLLHKNISDTLYKGIPRGVPESRREIVKSINDGRISKEELLTYNKNGTTYWANTITAPYKNEEGEIDGNIIIQQDITERKNMENALRESEQKYRQLSEMLPQTIYELDPQGHITYMNQTGLDKFGITASDLGISAFNFIVPAEHEKMRQNMRKSLEEEYYTPGNNYTAIRKNGEKFPVMIFASPMKSEGVIIGTRGIILDMTEHETMEKALRESEKKYKSLIEKATDGIVITQNGLLKFTNQAMCEMMQYSAEEFMDKSFYDYVMPEDHALMQQFHKRRMKGEKFNSLYRSHFIRKDGAIITVELNTRTSDYNGSPAAFIVIRNISDRLIIEKELIQAKNDLELLNKNLEERIKESSNSLTEARTQLIRLQKENLQSQFEVLRQQVNPHFLFNSLNVLTSLIKLEPELAEKFTEHLSKVYRYVLENKDNDLVDLKTELDFLDAYLFLLNIRFMDKIVVNINVCKDKTDWLILPLALQLLIENAIKHNSMSKKAPLCIDLFIDDDNFLNVMNNLQERESYIASTGVGLKNIEHRYQLLEMPAPKFIKTEKSFIAKIPLREPNNPLDIK